MASPTPQTASKNSVSVLLGDRNGFFLPETRVAAGPDNWGITSADFDGNGTADLAVVSSEAVGRVSYFAYGTLKYGVNVAGGNVDGDAYAEIVTGPGPGATFGPQIRGWNYDGATLTSIGKINYNAFGTSGYGTHAASDDVDGDAYSEIAATPGAGPANPTRFKGFNYDGTAATAIPGFDVTAPGGAFYGGSVGLGDITGDGIGDLVGGAGPDPTSDASVSPYVLIGGGLVALHRFDPFPASAYGVTVSSGALGY